MNTFYAVGSVYIFFLSTFAKGFTGSSSFGLGLTILGCWMLIFGTFSTAVGRVSTVGLVSIVLVGVNLACFSKKWAMSSSSSSLGASEPQLLLWPAAREEWVDFDFFTWLNRESYSSMVNSSTLGCWGLANKS